MTLDAEYASPISAGSWWFG